MSSIFTKEVLNNKRQIELDIAKGLAIIFMVWVHVNEYFQSGIYAGGVYNRVVEFLGSPPAAPVFMMLLGVGIIFSRKCTPKKLIERGIKLFIGGYALSFMRDVVPYYFLYKRSYDNELVTEAIDLLWGVDILQFAGLAFIFFALVVKFNLSNKLLFVIWCVLSTVNLMVRGITFQSAFANRFFGLFWGTDSYSWFPFLTWIVYPIVGYVFGQYLIRCIDKDRFYKNIFIYSGAITVPFWIYSYINDVQFGAFGELWQDAYYHHDILGNVVLISFALFWLSLIYFATPLVPNCIKALCLRWSKSTNNIYAISYIILGFSLLIIPDESLRPMLVCVLAVIIFVLSDLCSVFFDSMKKMLASGKRLEKAVE